MLESAIMDKIYDHKKVENNIYEEWEQKGYFKPEIHPHGKPYSIILPPPNANAPLHFGHAMYVIEDILIRYHRMKGYKTLWLPGADHAGFETQFVFEKKLASEGKSRMDYDRDTLFQMVWEYVHENRGGMEKQLRKLGFSLDWSRLKFTLDPDIVKIVYKTFKKLYNENLVYRDYRLVNYCTHDGTSFSDLEVVNEEREGTLYHIKFPIKEGGEIVIATTRPETFLGDVAVMVHPKDERYKDVIGKTVILPLINREIPIIADGYVDMKFGTGAVKVTPNHDFNDFEIAKKHNLTFPTIIGFDGKMKDTGIVDGLYAKEARRKIVKQLQENNLLVKEEKHKMVLRLCYKCKNVLEPLPMEQWFVKMEPLAKPGLEAAKSEQVKIFPQNFEKLYNQFLENIRDWNISRQVVWGMRIPAWKCDDCDAWIVTDGELPKQCQACKSLKLTQDPDTFDTWFSSGQWPFATLQTTQPNDFETFYPTTVMETGYDILRWWVARMVMFGLYETNNVPFKHVVLHGLVLDPLGKKMSKSKGNVVNPMELVEQYGADSVRFALVYGTALGNDQILSYPKLDAMRKFSNKLWNIGRYAEFYLESDVFKDKDIPFFESAAGLTHEEDKTIIQELEATIKKVSSSIDTYRFHDAADTLYEFTWHVLADKYMEHIKDRLRNGDKEAMSVFRHVFLNVLKLLHPFMPFLTEELWSKMPGEKNDMLIISSWPTI